MTEFALWVKLLPQIKNLQYFLHFWHARTLLTINSRNFKKTKRLQDLTAAVTASEKRRLHGHCQGSCTCPTDSVKANFNILHEVLGMVKKLAKRLHICYPRRRRSAHLVGRRRGPGPRKCTFFAWSVHSSVFPVSQRKEFAVCYQADPGGDEDDLGGGQGFHDRRPGRRRLLVVVGAHWKVCSDLQYICGKFREKTFLCISNSFFLISSVAFDFDCTVALLHRIEECFIRRGGSV